LEKSLSHPRHVPQIEVTFDIDSYGVIKVTAQHMTTHNFKTITISNKGCRLLTNGIDNLGHKLELYNRRGIAESHQNHAEFPGVPGNF
jgi:molecular chaperone DnaK (HSP70)